MPLRFDDAGVTTDDAGDRVRLILLLVLRVLLFMLRLRLVVEAD